MSFRPPILVVEDDVRLATMMVDELTRAGYRPSTVNTGADALFKASDEEYWLIILDLGLPDMDGLEVAEWLQKDSDVSILILTARGDIESRVQGLYAGASDYMTKPFSMQELLARVHARLRERGVGASDVSYGDLTLDVANASCSIAGKHLSLPDQELQVLHLLLTHRGRLLTREDLERRLYGSDLPSSNTVEVIIYKLRKRLAKAGMPNFILTIKGKGYMVR